MRAAIAMRLNQDSDDMTDELQELHEHAEHAREHPDQAPITITMAR